MLPPVLTATTRHLTQREKWPMCAIGCLTQIEKATPGEAWPSSHSVVWGRAEAAHRYAGGQLNGGRSGAVRKALALEPVRASEQAQVQASAQVQVPVPVSAQLLVPVSEQELARASVQALASALAQVLE